MPDSNRRHIAIVLDRSGSMMTVKSDTEGGLKAFLEAQTGAPGETTVSLYQFDDRYEAVYENTPLSEIPAYRLAPRGMTALLDAIGRTVITVGEQLAARSEDERPGEVVLVILTDGQENASREYAEGTIRNLISRQQDQYGWKFVFLGADQDAFEVSGGLGIGRESTLSYGSDHTKRSMTNAGHMVARGTRTGDYAFTDAERDETK